MQILKSILLMEISIRINYSILLFILKEFLIIKMDMPIIRPINVKFLVVAITNIAPKVNRTEKTTMNHLGKIRSFLVASL